MAGEPQVDVIAFNGPAGILAAGVAVAGHLEDGAIREARAIDGGRAVAGARAGGRDADLLALAPAFFNLPL